VASARVKGVNLSLTPPTHPSPPHPRRPQLGTKAGAEEIKSHPFFEGVNFALLRRQRPPYVPRSAAAAHGGNGGAGAGPGGKQSDGFETF
jgi:hypothetical protein